MRDDPLSYADLARIVELIRSTQAYTDVRLKLGGVEIELRKLDPNEPSTHTGPAAAAPAASLPAPLPASTAASPAAAPPAPAAAAPAAQIAEGMAVVAAPMVGTFYRSPEPGARPFVEVGELVGAHQTVCIIEVMKLMSSIPAGCAGRVQAILVRDAEMVEMGQPLIVVDPKG